MAIPINKYLGLSEATIKNLIANQYDITVDRIVRFEQTFDPRTGENQFVAEIKPLPCPDGLRDAIVQAKAIIGDDFRGPVIKAAVPELYKACEEMVKHANAAFQSQRIFVSEEVIYNLIKQYERNRTRTLQSRYNSQDRTGLSFPAGQADYDPFAALPKIHP